MPKIAVTLGIVLIVLGAGAYLGSSRESITALIPAFFGLPIALMGMLGRKEDLRKHAMHAAAVLALLGFLGSMRGIAGTVQLAVGQEVTRPTAALVQAAMAMICAVFLVLAVRSFVRARREAVN